MDYAGLRVLALWGEFRSGFSSSPVLVATVMLAQFMPFVLLQRQRDSPLLQHQHRGSGKRHHVSVWWGQRQSWSGHLCAKFILCSVSYVKAMWGGLQDECRKIIKQFYIFLFPPSSSVPKVLSPSRMHVVKGAGTPFSGQKYPGVQLLLMYLVK